MQCNAKILENQLYNIINNSGLSIETAFYVLKSVYLDLKNSYDAYVLKYENEEDKTTTTSTVELPIDLNASEQESVM